VAKTVIYLSPKHITVTRGTSKPKKGVRLTGKHIFPMPDGAVLNGVITDEESLYDALMAVKGALGGSALKDAALVLDTSHIIFRLAVLPVLSEKNMFKLIKNEFTGRVSADKEYSYDYSVLPSNRVGKKQRQVLCAAIDKAIIDSYKAFFNRVGITLSAMNFSTNAVLQAFRQTGKFDDRHSVICVVDHYIVSIISLLSNGEANFSRSRIISQVGDESYFTEISDIIYSYAQSRVSQDGKHGIESLRIFDSNIHSPEQYADVAQRLRIDDINVNLSGCIPHSGVSEDDSAKYTYNICVHYSSPPKDINLLKVYEPRKTDKKKVIRNFAILAAVLTAGALGYYLYTLHSETTAFQREIDDINRFLRDPQTERGVQDYNRLAGERTTLQNLIAQHAAYSRTVMSTPVAVSEVMLSALDVFGTKAEIFEITFSAQNGVITISAGMTYASEISYFVGLLRDTGLFRDITYMGYTGGRGRSSRHNFEILCYVKDFKGFGSDD
jgi:hypothetical protein